MQPTDDRFLQLRVSRDKAIQAAREAIRDTTRLTRLITILNDTGPLDLLLDRGLSMLSELFMADVVILLDPVGTGAFSPLAAIGLPEDISRMPFSDKEGSLIKRLLDTGLPVNIEKGVSCQDIDSQLQELGVETLVGLPINENNAVRGALILARCRPDPFSEADIGLLKIMAYRISRTLIEAQRSFQLEQIVECSREIHRHLDFDAVAAEAVKAFPNMIRADASALILRDTNGELYCAAQTGLCPSCCDAIHLLGTHLIESSLLIKNEVYSSGDVTAILTKFSLDHLDVSPVRAFLAIPITSKDHVLGILFGFRYTPIAYNFSTSQIAALYAEQVATALENSRLYQAMQNELAERQRLEEEKRKWEWQQQQIQKAKSLQRMAGAIAHHFNNQLGAVIGNLELALEGTPSDKALVKKYMTAAMQGANKAADVSGLMLTYLGQTTGKLTALNLAETCRENLPLLEALAPAAMRLKINLPPYGPTVSANPNQVQQILTNLLTNAWEAITENQGDVGLTVKTVSPADIPVAHRFPIDWQPQDIPYACLEIWDTGCGIAKDDIDKIFDPFFSRKFTGRGLGLSVVLGIVKAHVGAVTLETEVGQGSTFKVFFPISIAEIPKLPEEKLKSLLIKRSTSVLLVEDENLVREMAETMLLHLGLNVFTAKDGVEALEIFKNHLEEIQIVLSDLNMPRMNGWETLTAMRQIRQDLPVILVSGYDESTVLAGDHPELPQVFLHKPYQMAELQDAIARAMAS